MPATTDGPYRGVPAVERRAERRERLVAAGLDLLGTDGWSATTVRGVCERAHLTPRFFYESFASLDELALAVLDDVDARITSAVIDALVAAPPAPRARAEAAFTTLLDLLDADPRLGRVAFVEALGSEALARRRLAGIRRVAGVIAAQAQDAYGAPPDPRLLEVTSIVLAGGLVELLIVWLDGSLEAAREDLVADCVELFTATGDAVAGVARRRAP